MTTDDAGREERRLELLALDEAVGREVFGLEPMERNFVDGSGRSEVVWVRYGLRDDGGWIYARAAVERLCGAGVRLWGPDVHWHSLPKFSESFAAAWLLFIWLTEKYGGVGISSDMEEWDERRPLGRPLCGQRHPPVVVVVANAAVRVLWEPLPLALCHAALQAVRKEREEA